MLLFKKRFFEDIRNGRKTATLRYWRTRRIRPGKITRCPRLGRLRIDDVQPVEMEDLTEADARADGFTSLAELQAALAEMYPPDARAGRTLFQIRFTYVGRK